MVEVDYLTIGVISLLSGFGGALGTELAKQIVTEIKNHKKGVSK